MTKYSKGIRAFSMLITYAVLTLILISVIYVVVIAAQQLAGIIL